MNHLKSTAVKLATLFVVSSICVSSNASISVGGHVNYVNSLLKTNYQHDTNGLLTTDIYDYGISGFAPGVHIGYTFNVKDKYYINTCFSASYANAEHKGSHVNQGNDSESTFKLNHTLYPFITIGYQPTPDTNIGLSAGYGRENWTTTRTGENITFKTDADYDSNGWLIGGEISTHIMNNFSLSLSGMYSKIDKITASHNDDNLNQLHTLSIEPETTTLSVALQYVRN